MNLFQYGEFTSHSGLQLMYKIECDALTTKDWECFAQIIASSLRNNFYKVCGVPRGGLKLSGIMKQYVDQSSDRILIVDDVLTTGNSMLEYRKSLGFAPNGVKHIDGYVVFDRCPFDCWTPEISWIRAVCKMI